MANIKYLIIHHSGGTDLNPLQDSSNYTVKQCDADHKARFGMKSSLGWWVGYTYFIDWKGKVTQCRKDGELGAHTIGRNSDSIGICLAGNFDATLPTPEQVASLSDLINKKAKEFAITADRIVPHRHFASKTCFGKKLKDDWASNLLKPSNVILSPTEIGSEGAVVSEIQRLLRKGGYVLSQFNEGLYDENMAQSVLYFQMDNSVADYREISSLRGEKLGPKTVLALSKFQ